MLTNIKNITLSKILNEVFYFTIAFIISLVCLTYILKFPLHLTGAKAIYEEYYITNYMTNVPLDYFFVFVYFLIAGLVMRFLNLKDDLSKIITVAGVTILITGFFWLYFTSKKKSNQFFSRWFHTVGYKSVVYDVILLVTIYALFLIFLKL